MWVTIILSGLIFSHINAQEGQSCRTPLRAPGICIAIKKCDGLITLLKTQSNNPEVRNYLIQSNCGFSGVDPLVCCPNYENNNTPEHPTAAPTEAPVISEEISDKSNQISLMRTPHCGFSNKTFPKIVGGIPAELGQFPWMAELGYRNKNDPNQPKWLCGGSLITERHVLTAGHCVHNRPDLYLARLGDYDLYSNDDGANPVDIPLLKAKIHEAYSPTEFTNDIAILTLAFKPNSPSIYPICLPLDEPLRSNLFVKYLPFAAGWGSVYFNGPASRILQVVQLPVVNNDQCREAFSNFKNTVIDDRTICAGFLRGGKDTCKGDSGGPLMLGRQVDDSTFYYQIGIVSYGYRCAEEGYPGVYSRVTSFLDWISNNLD